MLPQLDLSNLTPSTSLDRKILSESDVEQFKRSLPFEWVQEYLKEMIDSTDPLAEIAPERPSPVSSVRLDFVAPTRNSPLPLTGITDAGRGRVVQVPHEGFTLGRIDSNRSPFRSSSNFYFIPLETRCRTSPPPSSFHLTNALLSLVARHRIASPIAPFLPTRRRPPARTSIPCPPFLRFNLPTRLRNRSRTLFPPLPSLVASQWDLDRKRFEGSRPESSWRLLGSER